MLLKSIIKFAQFCCSKSSKQTTSAGFTVLTRHYKKLTNLYTFRERAERFRKRMRQWPYLVSGHRFVSSLWRKPCAAGDRAILADLRRAHRFVEQKAHSCLCYQTNVLNKCSFSLALAMLRVLFCLWSGIRALCRVLGKAAEKVLQNFSLHTTPRRPAWFLRWPIRWNHFEAFRLTNRPAKKSDYSLLRSEFKAEN